MRLEESIGHMEEDHRPVAQTPEPIVRVDCCAGVYIGSRCRSHHARGTTVAVYRS